MLEESVVENSEAVEAIENEEVIQEEEQIANSEEEVQNPDEEEIDPKDNEEDDEEVEEGYEDVEFGGKVYNLPKAIRDGLMMQSDYTKKTQEVAEKNKSLEESIKSYEQEKQQYEEDFKSRNEQFDAWADLRALDNQIKAYEEIDWDRLDLENPTQAQKLWRERDMLLGEREQKARELSQKQQEIGLKSQQEAAKRLEETGQTLQREIKDWSPEKAQQVASYLRDNCKDIGVDEKVLHEINAGLYGAIPVVLANKAMLYDQLMQKQKQGAAKPKSGKKITPTKTVGSKSQSTNGLSDRLSTDEWMRRRREQLAKKR
jgi:DNA repair exonuclease SbcCD ATPase subunit